jgi:hypothetical protein
MSTFAEEGLKEIEELSSSSGYSFRTTVQELEKESLTNEAREKTRARATDLEAQMLAIYQLAAMKAKKADDAFQIREIWTRPLALYEKAYQELSAVISRGNTNPDFAHLLEVIQKLRDQVRWIYELHADH